MFFLCSSYLSDFINTSKAFSITLLPLNTTLFSIETYGNNIVYLKYLLDMFNLKRFIDATGVPTLNRNIVHKQKIINAPIKLQNKFADFVKQIDKQKIILGKTLKETEEIQESLMNKYFS